jgi:tol-pal system protein YbgF
MRRMSMMVAAFAGTLLLPVAATAQSAQGDLAGRVVKLEQALSNRGLLDLLNRIESLQQEVQALRGQLENQGYEIEQLKKSQAAVYTDIDRRLQTVEGGAGVPAAAAGAAPLPMLAPAPGDAVAGTPSPQSALQVETETLGLPPAAQDPLTGPDGLPLPGPAGAAPPVDSAAALDAEGMTGAGALPPPTGGAVAPALAPAPLTAQPPAGVTGPGETAPPLGQAPTMDDATSEAAYRDAFSLLRAGEYDRAVAAFNDFQTSYPNSQYGDNAQYWLAEAHYAKRDFAAAVTEYQKMLTAYPASRKLSHAMLKLGYSYDALGQPADARAILEELGQRFPGSAAARLAEERLAQLGAAAP